MPLFFEEDSIFKICVIFVHRTSTVLHFYFCTFKIKKEIMSHIQLIKTKDERNLFHKEEPLLPVSLCLLSLNYQFPKFSSCLAEQPAGHRCSDCPSSKGHWSHTSSLPG